MKAKKKRVGTKAQISARAILLIIILSSVAFSAYFGYTILSSSSEISLIEPTRQFKPENPNPELSPGPRAAIIDELALFCPNQTFVSSATDTLRRGGYSVDYYPSENVTVDLYRNLPSYNYSLIVFRVHSGYDFLFTSENYTAQEYVDEQLADQVLKVQVDRDSEPFFGIGENFIRQCMCSNFTDTLIILMGCNGLYSPDIARAFLERGASACVGWTGSIYASYTDEAITILLAQYVTKQMPLGQAISETMNEMGIDSPNGNHLTYYGR